MNIAQQIECVRKDKSVWIVYLLCSDRDECEEHCCYNPKVVEKKEEEKKSE